MPHLARHKDGTPVTVGDAGIVCWNSNKRSFVRITGLGDVRTFRSLRNLKLQIYFVRDKDGKIRPAHARHFKITYPAFKKIRKTY